MTGAAVLALVASPAGARLPNVDGARTYVEARAAAASGDHVRAAQLLASLAEAEPSGVELQKKALAEALGAGQIPLALNLAGRIPSTDLPTDARLLMAGAEIKRGHAERALPWLRASSSSGDLTFLAPLINAWAAADRGDVTQALGALDQVQAGSLLAPLLSEQRALILIKFKRTADAEKFARQALAADSGRDQRLRLAFADGFLAAGDTSRALMIIDGMGAGESAERQRIMNRRSNGQAIDSLPKALAEVLTAFSADLTRMQRSAAPIGLVEVARYLNPQSSSTTALLALLLAGQERTQEALALLKEVPATDALISQVRDVETRILVSEKRFSEAYAIASAAATGHDAEAADYSRLGDVLQAMKRHGEAAEAYGRALAIAQSHDAKSELWGLLLLRASALEQAGRWPEARAALQQGLALAPNEPLLLNFLGYAELERRENVDAAEAMIRKASELAPDDASITDSLGWAEFKRGKVAEAIATLQRAAEKDPQQAEIQEHLGDALYRSGRRFEARYAWTASLMTAEDEIAARVKAKLMSGLTPANAAP